MNIYLDFDDTITQSIENVVRIVNKRYNKNVRQEDISEWDFSDVYPDIPLQDIVKVFGEDEFFNTLRLKFGALFTIARYSKYNNIYIVSKVDTQAIEKKNDYIKQHIIGERGHIKFIGVPLGKSKGIVDMSKGIMVDDNADFLRETNAKHKILFKNNRKFDDKQDWDGLVVHNWLELDKMLYSIISNEKGYINGKI